jgi:hypothetical protein
MSLFLFIDNDLIVKKIDSSEKGMDEVFNFVNNSFVINIIGADLVEFLHFVDKAIVFGMKFLKRMFCGLFV